MAEERRFGFRAADFTIHGRYQTAGGETVTIVEQAPGSTSIPYFRCKVDGEPSGHLWYYYGTELRPLTSEPKVPLWKDCELCGTKG